MLTEATRRLGVRQRTIPLTGYQASRTSSPYWSSLFPSPTRWWKGPRWTLGLHPAEELWAWGTQVLHDCLQANPTGWQQTKLPFAQQETLSTFQGYQWLTQTSLKIYSRTKGPSVPLLIRCAETQDPWGIIAQHPAPQVTKEVSSFPMCTERKKDNKSHNIW